MSRRDQFVALRKTAPQILPSMLMCDFGDLRGEIERLSSAGAQVLHLDVMDGQFVPNFTYGMPIVAGMRKWTDLLLDVHLMSETPQNFLAEFYEAGADCLTIHVEAVEDPRPVLETIRGLGAAAGIALNPSTPLDKIADCLDLCDLVLVMSVEAGFGGQSFQEVALDRLAWLRARVGPEVLLEVDGGINSGTIAKCAAAGADLFVAGSAIFGQKEYDHAMRDLKNLAQLELR